MTNQDNSAFLHTVDNDLTTWNCRLNRQLNLSQANNDEVISSVYNSGNQDLIKYQPLEFMPNQTDKNIFVGTHISVFNFNYFEKQFNSLFKRANLLNTPINLALLMIDNLEDFAKTYQMPICISLVSAISEILQKKLEEPQFASLCVFGYFAVVLPELDLANCVLKLEKFRNEIAGHTFIINNKSFSITTSVGVANYPNHAKHPGELKLASIQALQHAINKGGDRLTVY